MDQQFIDFCLACYDGHLEIVQWLLSVNPDINISAENEYAFRCVCYRGHLEIARWLLSVNPNINISAETEYAFRWACSQGHLEIAQWLLSVNPNINISARDEWAFRSACEHKHLDVAQWLQTLKPYLYVINYNENKSYKSYHIRTKEEEQRLIQKMYASWLASDNSPNKNNIIYQLPLDISHIVISYI
jgi:ankyrin repeat protein